MSEKTADLHIHTNFSDSALSPVQVVESSLKCGLSAIAIADHDTLEGVSPACEAVRNGNIEIIPGLELSSQVDGKDIHVLGYYIDCSNKKLQESLQRMQEVRISRIKGMIDKLKEGGVDGIDPQDVFDLAQSDAVGRMHLAIILKEHGWVSSISEAFDRFIGDGSPAYVPKLKQTPFAAIDLIHQAGGLAVLAHPMVNNKDELISSLVEAGLDGIEVYYPNTSKETIAFYEGIAHKHNLIATGGSDAHGNLKDNTFIGKMRVPFSVVEQMKELHRRRMRG